MEMSCRSPFEGCMSILGLKEVLAVARIILPNPPEAMLPLPLDTENPDLATPLYQGIFLKSYTEY